MSRMARRSETLQLGGHLMLEMAKRTTEFLAICHPTHSSQHCSWLS